MEETFTFEQMKEAGIVGENSSWVDFKAWRDEGTSFPSVNGGTEVIKTGRRNKASVSACQVTGWVKKIHGKQDGKIG